MKNKIKYSLLLVMILIFSLIGNTFASTNLKIEKDNNFEEPGVVDIKKRDNKNILYGTSGFRSVNSIRGHKEKGKKEDVIKRIKEEYDKNNFPKEYKLRYIEYIDEDSEWEAKFEEEVDGILNPYKGIKLKYSETDNKIVFFKEFNNDIEKKQFNISKEKIKKNEKEYIELIANQFTELKREEIKLNVDNAKIEIVKPNTFMRKDIKDIKQIKKIEKVWVVEFLPRYYVYIDVENGNIVGGKYDKYAEALVASTGEVKDRDGNLVDPPAINAMGDAFNRLGYKTFGRREDARTEILKDWIYRGGSQYAFYISTHGLCSANGEVGFVDKNGKIWTGKDIKGNWDFVFIDACSSKANDSLAHGFRIYNNSKKKAYLGWKEPVGVYAARDFVVSFARKLGSKPVQAIAKETAENMAEYVPIRFTGDRGWYGYAR